MSNQSPSDNQLGHPSDCEILEQYRSRSQQRIKENNSPERKVLLAKAEPLQLLLLDVDGVLSDGSLIYTENGIEGKTFNTKDGLGIKLVQQCGIEVGLITARTSQLVQKRGEELGMKYIIQGVGNKLDTFKAILKQSLLKPFQVGYMGDDWIDLALLSRVGFAACPSNGVPEVRDICHFISTYRGGEGAVREVCDIIIQAKGCRDSLLHTYLK